MVGMTDVYLFIVDDESDSDLCIAAPSQAWQSFLAIATEVSIVVVLRVRRVRLRHVPQRRTE
jgi:hypothetical protein